MPRKSKKPSKETEPSTAPAIPTNGVSEKAPRPTATKTTRKSSAKKAGKRTAKTSPAMAPQPTDEEIRLRAYFIAERRHRLALPGDAESDWLEAKRQLVSEAPPR